MSILNAFTVDLEDWFQGLTSTNTQPGEWDSYEARLESNAHCLLAILGEFGVRATFFVLGHVANRYPDLIRHIAAAGHEIGVHGYWHLMVHRIRPERFAAELPENRLFVLRNIRIMQSSYPTHSWVTSASIKHFAM